MTIYEAYLSFLEKVNKNHTNDNFSADKARFIQLFNEVQNKYVEWILEKRNEDEIRYIQRLLIFDRKLSLKHKVLNHQAFTLPTDFFDFVNIQAFGSQDSCKNKKISLFEIKQENVEELLNDEFNKPSFKFRETFYSLGTDSVNVYVDNFNITKAYLTYYRYPKQVDIEGYLKPDGTQSITSDPEFDDKVVDRVITACSKDFNINGDNLQRTQFDKDRLFSKV